MAPNSRPLLAEAPLPNGVYNVFTYVSHEEHILGFDESTLSPGFMVPITTLGPNCPPVCMHSSPSGLPLYTLTSRDLH